MKTRKRSPVKSSEERLREIERLLRDSYGSPRHHNPTEPLDDLVFLVLSRMTQEVKYRRTYDAIRAAMPEWSIVRDAPPRVLEDLITDAGLAHTKSAQIQLILQEIERREGTLDLSRLQQLPDDEVECYLTSLPGVGRKTARCVMLYTLNRSTCPVDAHVWRVMRRLGFTRRIARTDRSARDLEACIPIDIRASLHVTLIAHGRMVCRARTPKCPTCAIEHVCSKNLDECNPR